VELDEERRHRAGEQGPRADSRRAEVLQPAGLTGAYLAPGAGGSDNPAGAAADAPPSRFPPGGTPEEWVSAARRAVLSELEKGEAPEGMSIAKLIRDEGSEVPVAEYPWPFPDWLLDNSLYRWAGALGSRRPLPLPHACVHPHALGLSRLAPSFAGACMPRAWQHAHGRSNRSEPRLTEAVTDTAVHPPPFAAAMA
jgi:hypothetical protein